MTPSVNARNVEGRSILSLLVGRELQRCLELVWNTSKTSAAILQAWNRLDPVLAIRWLLEVKSIDVNNRDVRNQNALIHATKVGFRRAVAMLLDHSKCALETKKRSLIYAVNAGRDEIAYLLLTSIT